MVRVEWNEEALFRLLDDENGPVGHDLQRRALAVEGQAIRNLSQPGTGRVYRRRGIAHQASAPGEPPAVDTGLLRASVGHSIGHDEKGLFADVGTSQKVGLWTEMGTRHMAPRPWIRPALDAAKEV